MVHHLLIAVSGVVLLVLGWVAVQALVRHESPEMDRETDVLRCGLCGNGANCMCGLKRQVMESDNEEEPLNDRT